jgi:hypothetical protein
MVSILSFIIKIKVMKSIKIYLSLIVFAISLTSCGTPPRPPKPPKHPSGKPMPLGQAKKVLGTKSAKPFAPGQNK